MKLNEIAKYKQWTKGQVVRDREGKVHVVDSQDGVKVYMQGHSHGWFHPNNLTEVDPKEIGT